MADFRSRLEQELVRAAGRPARLRYARAPLPQAGTILGLVVLAIGVGVLALAHGAGIGVGSDDRPAASTPQATPPAAATPVLTATPTATPDSAVPFSALAAEAPTISDEADEIKANLSRLAREPIDEVRVAGRLDEYTLYVGWGERNLCTWLVSGSGGVTGCSTLEKAADVTKPIGVTQYDSDSKRWIVFGLLPDAATAATLEGDDGSRTTLRPVRNVVITRARSGQLITVEAGDRGGSIKVPRR